MGVNVALNAIRIGLEQVCEKINIGFGYSRWWWGSRRFVDVGVAEHWARPEKLQKRILIARL